MNELAKLTNGITTADGSNIAKAVLGVCTAITPQFYKNKSDLELRAEKASIEMILQGKEPEVVSEMCRLAVEHYAEDRSKDARLYFDINYIVRFYREAYNRVHNSPPADYCLIYSWRAEGDITVMELANIDTLDLETGEMNEQDLIEVRFYG